MRSTSGAYYPQLDHVRAVAAYLVFLWHTVHGAHGIKDDYVPSSFIVSPLEEGHVGVAIFMTLSGYLFAKLLDGAEIDYWAFLRNRAIRLLPLLVFTQGLYFALGGAKPSQLIVLLLGVILPTLPAGGWSITVECHFYAILPKVLRAFQRFGNVAVLMILITIALRGVLWTVVDLRVAAYWTIIGRFDQFVLGIFFFFVSGRVVGRHVAAACALLIFCLVYHGFNIIGGFWHAPRWVFILLPTVEGLLIGWLIAYYDGANWFKHGLVSRALAWVGTVSYSIYLLHFFVAYNIFHFLIELGVDLKDMSFAEAWAIATGAFILFVPVASLTYCLIERPFLQFRVPYRRPISSAPRISTAAQPAE